MSEGVLVTLIATGGSVLLGIFSGMGVLLKLLLETRTHARSADEQVSNDHTTNLREESDTRHLENSEALDDVKKGLNALRGEMRGIRRDVGRLWDQDTFLAGKLYDIENTSDRESIEYARDQYRSRSGDRTGPQADD